MALITARVLVLVVAALAGVAVASGGGAPAWLGALVGGATGGIGVLAEFLLRRLSVGAVGGGAVGIAFGLAIAALTRLALGPVLSDSPWAGSVSVGLTLAGAYVGAVVGGRRGPLLDIPALGLRPTGPRAALASEPADKVLDTSVIIDGRIADIIHAGFLEGVLVIPQFILAELQQVADSSDPLKRNRGRKGLDVLKEVQDSERVVVELTDADYPDIKEVDAKLLALAEERSAKVLTNDYNLNKVAQLRGVPVLNVNDLANAMKPVVLPGETMTIQILKEGKERNQGVAYLDDGTMVVVDNGKPLIGETIEVVVTSVIQTNAGKMIFASPTDEDAAAPPRVARRVSSRDPSSSLDS